MKLIIDTLVGMTPFVGFFIFMMLVFYLIKFLRLSIKYLKLKIEKLEHDSR